MMKLRIGYLLLFFLLLGFSCSRRADKLMPLLLHADSLIQVSRADSALKILENIPSGEFETPASQAKYALLLTQARDKNYVLHTSDSLIRIAVDYYDTTRDILSRAKAHYYWGRVYQDMNNVEGTVREFFTAMPLAEEVDDYNLICLLQGNLGHLFLKHRLLDEADSLYKCAARLAETHRDSLHWVLSLTHLGDICVERGHEYYIEAEDHFNRGYMILKASKGSVNIERTLLTSLGVLCGLMGRYPEAISHIKHHIALQPDTTVQYGNYMVLGNVYYKNEQYDSARIYLTKCLFSNNNGLIELTYMHLAEIAEKCGKDEEALAFEKYRQIYGDSARLDVHQVEVVSSFKDVLKQQSVIKYESFLNYYLFYIVILILVLLFFGIFFIYRHKLNFGISFLRRQSVEKAKGNLIEERREISLRENKASGNGGREEKAVPHSTVPPVIAFISAKKVTINFLYLEDVAVVITNIKTNKILFSKKYKTSNNVVIQMKGETGINCQIELITKFWTLEGEFLLF